MDPFECYVDYLALKRHFSVDSYDYFRYYGKVKANINSFNKRNDIYNFEKLSKRDDAHEILLAHMSEKPDLWIGSISPDGDYYSSWRKRQVSIEYSFKEEIKMFEWPAAVQTDGQHPVLLKSFLRHEVSKETMVILNSIIRYAPYWSTKVQDEFLWPKINFNLKKYSPFVKFELAKYKVLLDEHIKHTK